MTAYDRKQYIGLFGFGVVGESLYHVISNSPSSNADIIKICIKNPHKPRSLPPNMFCHEASQVISDPAINLVVELIDNAEEAFHIVCSALRAGKSVVSGNKKMLATHMDELVKLQEETGAALLYDASACGSIPVIRNLEEYYDTDLLLSITGILNGSSNYILSQAFHEQHSYEEALAKAQELGFAESNPALDVDGLDAVYKLTLLTLHGFGLLVDPDSIFRSGIRGIKPADIRFARERGYRIKPIAQARKFNGNKLALFVMPKLVTPDEYIYNVENEYNGVVIEGTYYDKQFMFGKGAGGFPTGSSVLSDIMARTHQYRYEYKKRRYLTPPAPDNDIQMEVYFSYRNPNDLQLMDFIEITEQYGSRDHYFVIGRVSLQKLFDISDSLSSSGIFLACIRLVDDQRT